jgi:hypothetical protein
MEFTAQWSLDGRTVTVKRDFKVSVDQPLCEDDLPKEAAKALSAIRDSCTRLSCHSLTIPEHSRCARRRS